MFDRIDERLRLEPWEDDDLTAGQQRSGREAQGGGVVHRRDDEVGVVGREAPQLALLEREAAGVVVARGARTTRPSGARSFRR